MRQEISPTALVKPTSSANVLNPVADWKLYTGKLNINQDFSFMYPNNWTVTDAFESTIQDPPIVELHTLDRDYAQGTAADIYFFKQVELPSQSRLEELGIKNGESKNYGSVKGTLYKTEGTGEAGEGYRIDYVFQYNSVPYWIYLSTNLKNKYSYEKIFNGILKSFSFYFIDQNQVRDISPWQTYTNKAYAFSLQYPQNYLVTESVQNQVPLQLLLAVIKSQSPTPGGGYPQPNVEVVVYKNDAQDLNSWLLKHTTALPFDDSSVSKDYTYIYRGIRNRTETVLGGQKAITFESRSFESSPNPTLTQRGDYIIGIVLDNENEMKDPNLKTMYSKILSSFKFLN